MVLSLPPQVEYHYTAGQYGKALEEAHHSECIDEERGRIQEDLLIKGFSRVLCDDTLTLRAEVLDLLHLVGMPEDFETVVKINEWAQAHLKRSGERWQEQSASFDELAPRITPLLQSLGFIDGVEPHFKEYDGVIVHGASLPRVAQRIAYLFELWKEGVQFEEVYFLSSERPLDPDLESVEQIFNPNNPWLKFREDWLNTTEPTTEYVMILSLLTVAMPKNFDKIISSITVDMKYNYQTETLIRPNTEDTVKAWIKSKNNLLEGRYLAISNAPYLIRQDWIVRHLAPNLTFETVGPKVSEDETIALILDELASNIYEIKKIWDKRDI